MNDDELIDHVADLWVRHGGDAEGLDYMYSKLRLRIKEKEEMDK